MRRQKIRGFNRRFRDVDLWIAENLNLRHDLLEKYNGDHIGIVVHPWCDISIINSEIPEPKSKMKKIMLKGLIDIYESWKIQLDKLNKPYYLKIWLFEPRFSKSQVVCAVSDRIENYKNNFFSPEFKKQFDGTKYGKLGERLKKFDWVYNFDEDHFEDNFVGEPKLYASQKDYEEAINWFNRLLKKPHRITKLDEDLEEPTEVYAFRRGDLWIGGLK